MIEGFMTDPSNTLPYVLQEPKQRRSLKFSPQRPVKLDNSDLNLSVNQIKKPKGTKTGQEKYQAPINRQVSPKAGSSPTAQKKQGENPSNERK